MSNGKGDRNRSNPKAFRDGYDEILWEDIRDEGKRTEKDKRKIVTARCSGCGKDWEVRLRSIKRGTSRSCKHCSKKTHGYRLHKLYPTWRGMMARCYDEKSNRYNRYGALGIDVAEPWHNVGDFIQWIEANLGERPEGFSLDRIDNSRGYHPDNVRWADAKTQANNRGGK